MTIMGLGIRYFEEFLYKSFSFINKITIKYKINVINFTEVYGKNF